MLMKTRVPLLIFATAMLWVLSFSIESAQSQDETDPSWLEEIEPDVIPDLAPVLGTARAYGGLETFLELLSKAGLDKDLKGAGPYTLFIPDDSAFSLVPPEQLEEMMSDAKHLKAVLSRHIVVGKRVLFGDGPESVTVRMMNKEEMNVNVTEEAVRIGGANVVDEEIECSNGVIHIIDKVMQPQKW